MQLRRIQAVARPLVRYYKTPETPMEMKNFDTLKRKQKFYHANAEKDHTLTPLVVAGVFALFGVSAYINGYMIYKKID